MTVSAEVVALLAAAVAVFAAVLAVRATALTARTVLANQAQLPRDEIQVVEGHTRRDLASDTRDYVFVVNVANRSATERRFEPPTLRVTYRTRANFLGAVDLSSQETIVAPANVLTKATVRYRTTDVIPRHCRIDAYALHFVADTGDRVVVDASLPSVLQADTDGAGPATWGWD